LVISVSMTVALLPFSARAVKAQQPSTGASSPASAPSPAPAAAVNRDDRYRIGPGDVLDIRVFDRPQLSREAVRVDGRGMIRMPLLDDDIQAACLTEGELAKEIATRYLKYQRNPHVDVFIKEFNSQPVAVIGAVNAPGRFQLQRRVRLLELISFAGGPSQLAGGRIQIVRASESLSCDGTGAGGTRNGEAAGGLLLLKLSGTLRGEEQENPYVRPGDIVSLPEAEQAFVVGNVFRPSPIPLKEPITISRAIAMAGGLMPDSKSDKIRLVRQADGGMTKTEQIVDLKAINRHQATDILLQAGDIVEVPTSGGKTLLRSLAGAIAPTVSQLPIRVIP
jgi:polysaccharide export outer membrane protein